VADRLNALTPGQFAKRTALFSTGAEALENAVKIARAATGRPGVVVFDHAYHGRSLMTLAMTYKEVPYKSGFGPFPADVHRAPFAYPLRWPTGPDNAAPRRWLRWRSCWSAWAPTRSPRSSWSRCR
jgi:4-aminobutyrate aminotransferase/(S)-3-amino-2-methylpropionate transaminase